MIRFYIKNNEVVFSLFPKEYETEQDLKVVADCSGSYDKFIDKDTNHTRWIYANGELQEQLQPNVE